jgi:hypothetical protein
MEEALKQRMRMVVFDMQTALAFVTRHPSLVIF